MSGGELVNSIYDEVCAPKMDSSPFKGFDLRDNQSHASHHRESMDERPTQKTNKYVSMLSPISVIILIVIVIALSGGLIFAFFELSKFKSKFNLQQSSLDKQTKKTEEMVIKVEQLKNDTNLLIQNLLNPHLALTCEDIHSWFPAASSGEYWVRSELSSTNDLVYCDMTRSCGGVTGGWMRVAHVDMRDEDTMCPGSLELMPIPFQTCRISSNNYPLCSADLFSAHLMPYSHVCGMIKAYQFGSPDAFGDTSSSVNRQYVDGIVLITNEVQTKHIWTFAAAQNENANEPTAVCPCINMSTSEEARNPPSFVGDDYFCDTAATNGNIGMFYEDDPMWDGAGCGPQNTCCSFNKPPWFYKKLLQPTTAEIQMRLCRDETMFEEDILIEIVEIYVQ